ncbi:hypothetical protein [Paraflavitalea pollutisoli]|uniref:hypothetical protein n=1 Tax=Paraflavitalea pollutisoli TaxID=3034143 RepID=UPI0023EC1B84|nr:hypothetical protein [Paraflavitalea sp. H1-2-19X]
MNYKVWLVVAVITGGLVSAAYHHPTSIATITTSNTQAKAGVTDNKVVCVYMIYNGFGPENDRSSYDTTSTAPASCNGHDIICFFRICDDDGDVTPAEFDDAFNARNLKDPALNYLSDEDEIPGELEKYTSGK